MEKDARLFNCICCLQQTMICSCCDRGNIYCSSECSQAARADYVQAAGRRYQNTRRGKSKHAARQRRYRQRQKEKVTHQGSPLLCDDGLLPFELSELITAAIQSIEDISCHFCGKGCSRFLRIGFMRHRSRYAARTSSSWPHGP